MSLRDDIARLLFYGLDSSRNEEAADAILALPALKAREAVIEACRLHAATPIGERWHSDHKLVAAVADLDALERQP